jgi:hypothetical protein
VDISGGKDFLCRGQRSGITKLADSVGFEFDSFGGKNGGIGNHLTAASNMQAKRVYTNKFWRRFRHE